MNNTLLVLSAILLISTVIPLIRHDYWIFRVFEYPRLQKFVLNIALLLIIIFWPIEKTRIDWIIITGLIVNLIYLSYLILPFTIFGKRQIISSKIPPDANNLKILIANVYQENKNSKKYHELIKTCEADVILLVETNLWWQEQMDSISDNYLHQLKVPLENTYGMLLYSKLPLIDGEIKFLVEKDIPSIETLVTLKSGQKVKLFCLHPQPPVPQENPRSTERDKEILMIAKKAKSTNYPVVVMGDLNDVAWSYTTELFGKVSGLLDPRRGRGFFNSFNAKYFFLRFPLDHIFCSTDFTLTSIKRLQSCGSDHFPMCVNLQFNPTEENENSAPTAEAEDIELAEDKINASL